MSADLRTLTAEESLDYLYEIQAELRAGNWPPCPTCNRTHGLHFVGIVAGIPTFQCSCDAIWGVDLLSMPG